MFIRPKSIWRSEKQASPFEQGEEQGYEEGIEARKKHRSFHSRSAPREGNRSLALRNQGFRILTPELAREGDEDP